MKASAGTRLFFLDNRIGYYQLANVLFSLRLIHFFSCPLFISCTAGRKSIAYMANARWYLIFLPSNKLLATIFNVYLSSFTLCFSFIFFFFFISLLLFYIRMYFRWLYYISRLCIVYMYALHYIRMDRSYYISFRSFL